MTISTNPKPTIYRNLYDDTRWHDDTMSRDKVYPGGSVTIIYYAILILIWMISELK